MSDALSTTGVRLAAYRLGVWRTHTQYECYSSSLTAHGLGFWQNCVDEGTLKGALKEHQSTAKTKGLDDRPCWRDGRD